MNSREHKTSDTSTSAFLALGEGPELARLVGFRLVGTAVLWAMGVSWWAAGAEVNLSLLHVACGVSLLLTGWVIATAKRSHRPWLSELHVAADIVILPAIVLATGGWRNPFAGILIIKGVMGGLLVGPRRGGLYGFATIAVAWVTWVWPLLGGPFSKLAGPTVVAFMCAAIGAGLLQATALPLDIYRSRRRELAAENRRLEEAIGELESQNRRLVALHSLARDIGSLGRIEEVAVRLRDAVLRTFPGYAVAFFLFRRDTGWLEPILLPEGVDGSRAARLGGPEGALVKAVLHSDQPIHGDGTSLLETRNAGQLLVPLWLAGKPVGLLLLEDRVDFTMNAADTQLLGTMGSEMAVALRNAELHARTMELRESLESLIDNANALIFVVDPLGTVEVANRALSSLLPKGESAIGRPAALLFSDASAMELSRALETVRGGSPVENVTLAVRHGDKERRAAFNLAPVLTPDGKFRSAIAVGQDVTRIEMLERSIVQTEKLASLGQFVAGIAHEMNNPLTAITAYGDYLRSAHTRGVAPADAGDKLDNIVSAGERIRGFVQSLLGLARPAGGKRRDVDVNAVVRDAVRLCSYDLKKTALDVKTDLAAELPWIAGVENELQQVFINLFVNASHAMPDGGELRISTSPSDDGVRVTVADTGTGIQADSLPRIFEAFYTTKEEGKGTGLGLSIVKKIIEQHGGRISVESEPGKGTTFTIDLPRAAREVRTGKRAS